MKDQVRARLRDWIAVSANIGVVIGLVILVYEVRQNAELTSLSIEIAKNDLFANIEFHLSDPALNSAWIKSYRSPETLTESELRMVESIYVALMMQWDYMFQMEDRGLVSERDVSNHVGNAAPLYFGSRLGKAWFEGEMQFWQGTRMQEIALPIVRAVDPDYISKHYDDLLSTLQNSAHHARIEGG